MDLLFSVYLSPDDIVMREACGNFNTGSGAKNPCCEHKVDIAVKNCTGFYVYYLSPTPSCPVAYCAGGFTWDKEIVQRGREKLARMQRERERGRDRQRERERDRQTVIQTETGRQTKSEIQVKNQPTRQIHMLTGTQRQAWQVRRKAESTTKI